MKLQSLISSLFFFNNSSVTARARCTSADPCWPSPHEWSKFNASINGNLIASRPSAAVCHGTEYNSALCENAGVNWVSSDWRTGQPGAYSAILWELGRDQCFINSTVSAPCGQGLVAKYTVNASSIEDVQKAVKWADRKNLFLVIKNTGHDHLGRSSGEGAFAIWTHHLKGRKWHDDFVPQGAPGGVTGVKAVTLNAGEQWLDVYRDADKQGQIIVGGHARTVGAAGGWATGGGHSAWSHFYGLGADNIWETRIVAADGETKVLNQYTDVDHFWAIRGGAGNSWGVITSITYKTHPVPTHIKVVFAQYTTNYSTARRQTLGRIFRALPEITDAGYTGYGTLGSPIGIILLQPNGTNTTAERVTTILKNIGDEAKVDTMAAGMDFPTWIDYVNVFLQDPNVATNVVDPSRLLTPDVLLNKTEKLLGVIDDFPDFHPGFNFIGKVDSRNRDQTAVHSVWKTSRAIFSMGTDWKDDAPESEKRTKRLRMVDVSRRLAEIVGEGGGTYVNEANPYEPDWKQAFWGEKYSRLERINRRIDSKGIFVCNRCVGGDLVYKP
ncbi:putative FAD binding domain protein [Dendryphion nanum]|uniref:FAD binding domain protein n=1 Tax=Dendryphion nanum TaxID=256645 RepID=A0A9P9IK54_9PLEO|nr:putative FAD binding domain protein [Dendryphion nanum]